MSEPEKKPAEMNTVVLVEANAQAFILSDDPKDGWKNMETFFCTLTHIADTKDGLQVELFDKDQNTQGKYKWNPARVKSKEDSRYLVLLAKPWDKSGTGDKYLTMTLKFHTDAGAQTWSSISEDMLQKLDGIKKPSADEQKIDDKEPRPADEDEDGVKKLEPAIKPAIKPGTYTIVSSKVDWVSFWSDLDEKKAHRTLLPVNSVVDVGAESGKDSRGKIRTKCKVVHLYYPQFSELADDEVPQNGASGFIKGNYLARREKNLPIVSADTIVEREDAMKLYEDELVMMDAAFKEISKLTGLDRALALRAIRVTLQHVIINPYRPRRLKKSNAKHANIFLHECGPSLLAVVGFEVEGNKELYLESAAAKTDMAKLILQEIAEITTKDLERGRLEREKDPVPAPAAAKPVKGPSQALPGNSVIKLNVGGTTFQTLAKSLFPCTKLDFGSIVKDDSGAYFIDRDADIFKSILGWLRSERLPSNMTNQDLEDLANEAHFFGINKLVAQIKELQDRLATQIPNQAFLNDHFQS